MRIMDKALKLADLKEFEKMLSVGYLPAVKQAIEMLRQQQAEIEALKVKAHEWYLIAMGKAQDK